MPVFLKAIFLFYLLTVPFLPRYHSSPVLLFSDITLLRYRSSPVSYFSCILKLNFDLLLLRPVQQFFVLLLEAPEAFPAADQFFAVT